MSCAERRDRLYDRLYALLDEADASELDRHLAACADCRREWERLKGRDALLDAWTPEYRPGRPVRVALPSRRLPAWAVAAAALFITVTTTVLFPSPLRYQVVGGAAFPPGNRLVTTEASAIRLGRAGRVDLEPGSELLFRRGGPGLDHELELVGGTAHVEVYPTGRSFKIALGERTLEVRGTRFTVRRLGDRELGQILGEDSMKRWNLASVSVALVTVTTGSVVLSGPDGKHPVEAGRSVLATPAGVEKVDAGESLDTVRKVRDELLRSLAARSEKNRALRAELDALQGKRGDVELPPGATLESLLSALQAAYRKADGPEVQLAVARLGLLLQKEPGAFDGVMKTLTGAKDPQFASLVCAALWHDGGGNLISRRAEVLKLFLSPELPMDVRLAVTQSLWSALGTSGRLTDAESATLLRAAQALSGNSEAAAKIRLTFATIAGRTMSAPSETFSEFQRYLAAETSDQNRLHALQEYFGVASRQKGSDAAESLLLEALQGRYGAAVAADRLSQPLLPWFRPENEASFARALQQAASQLSQPAQRQSVAGQLGLLHLIQRSSTAKDALRQVAAAEQDPAARARMGDVIEAIDKGTLDLDKLMEKLQLDWNF